MNGTMTLNDLKHQVQEIEDNKNDYVVPSRNLSMSGDNEINIYAPDSIAKSFKLNDIAHGQVADKLEIPRKFYGRLPGLGNDTRSDLVNKILGREKHQMSYLLRTVDKTGRAFLSDKYRPFDNMLVLSALLPVLDEQGTDNIKIKATVLTDARMYLQVIFPKISGEVKVGDVVQAGLTITNSEVGWGAVDIAYLLWRLTCSNGAIAQSLVRKMHLGARLGNNEEDFSLFSHETVQAEVNALYFKMRDVFDNAITEQKMEHTILKLRAAIDDKIENVQTLTKNVTKRFGFTKVEADKFSSNLVNGGNANRYGVGNAITGLVHEEKNPDRQYDFEKVGGTLLLDDSKASVALWKEINQN